MKKLPVLLSLLPAVLITAACGMFTPPEVPTYQAETEETYTEFVTYPDMDTMSPKTIE